MDISSINSNYSEMMRIRGDSSLDQRDGMRTPPPGVEGGKKPPPPPEIQKLKNSLSEEEEEELDQFMKDLFNKLQSGDLNKNEVLGSIPDSVKEASEELGINFEQHITNIIDGKRADHGRAMSGYGDLNSSLEPALLDIMA